MWLTKLSFSFSVHSSQCYIYWKVNKIQYFVIISSRNKVGINLSLSSNMFTLLSWVQASLLLLKDMSQLSKLPPLKLSLIDANSTCILKSQFIYSSMATHPSTTSSSATFILWILCSSLTTLLNISGLDAKMNLWRFIEDFAI